MIQACFGHKNSETTTKISKLYGGDYIDLSGSESLPVDYFHPVDECAYLSPAPLAFAHTQPPLCLAWEHVCVECELSLPPSLYALSLCSHALHAHTLLSHRRQLLSLALSPSLSLAPVWPIVFSNLVDLPRLQPSVCLCEEANFCLCLYFFRVLPFRESTRLPTGTFSWLPISSRRFSPHHHHHHQQHLRYRACFTYSILLAIFLLYFPIFRPSIASNLSISV